MDPSSVFVATTYQAGAADGWFYAFTPDGRALFSRSRRLDTDRIQINCGATPPLCTIKSDDGTVAQMSRPAGQTLSQLSGANVDGMAIARAYANWVLGTQLSVEPEPPPRPAQPPPVVALPSPAPAPVVAQAPQPTPQPAKAVLETPQPVAAPLVTAGDLGPDQTEARKKKAAAKTAEAAKAPVVVIPTTLPPNPNQPILVVPPPGQAAVLTVAGPEAPVVAGSPSRVDCSVGYGLQLHGKRTAALFCNLAVTKSLTLHGSAFYYFDQANQKPWDPDYTYVASYALTPALTLTYSNYAGNYFPWHNKPSSGGQPVDGTVQASYALPFNNTLFGRPAGSFPDFSMVVGGGYTLRGKPQMLLSIGVTPIPKLSMRLTAAYYPIHHLQEPWDGDFSYTASYQITDNLSIQYNNYSGNRWLWDNGPSSGTTIRDGSLLLLYRFFY